MKREHHDFKKFVFYWIFIPILFLFIFLLSGCQSLPDRGPIKKGDKIYGVTEGLFQHRWWHYYERALSYMEGEFYDYALQDLEIAIKKRAEDKRRARTYGMHFIDYFPHREKGVTYYLLRDYDLAQQELELSIQQEPSAKALFYRDKIRKILLKAKKAPVSVPVILVNQPSNEIWTKDDPVMVSGTAKDAQYISRISLNGQRYYFTASQQQIEFSKPFNLDQGEHVIDIYAENLTGGNNTKKLIIHVDRQGPVITLDPPSTKTTVHRSINGYVYDESGTIELYANGIKFPVPKGVDAPFSIPVKPGTESVHLVAKDKLGNETQAKIEINSLETQKEQVLVAANEHNNIASDAGNFNLAFSFKPKDKYPPTLKLNGWTDEQTVFMEKVYIEGDVRDQNSIVDLTINQIPVLRRKGSTIFFNHLMNLKEGKNTVKIEAEDESGNRTVREFTIVRDIPKVLQIGSRFSIAIIPFDNKGLDTGLNHSYDNQFLVKLMDQNRFRIIERAKLDLILKEQKLSSTKLIDESTALELGKLAAVHGTMVGNFIETRIGIEVVARLVDNETSEILAVKDVYDEFKDRAALLDLAEGLAIKFHREFPLLDGMIIDVKGNSFYIDLGKGMVKPNSRLIVYKESEPIRHPVTGKILGKDTRVVGRARVTQVMEQMAKVDLIKKHEKTTIDMKDRVITE